jgi:hypothetical protein
MRDEEIDDILKTLASKTAVEPELLDRISLSVGSDLQSVASMPPSWILVGRLILIGGLVAVSGAILLGGHGFRAMSPLEISVVLAVLGVWMGVAASQCVVEAIPGSRRIASPLAIALSGCLILTAIFGVLFRDYHAERFVTQGIKCLAAGIGFAIPAALGIWFVLRNGFTTNATASGFARGMLAGLAGLTMLELHCPNLEVPHLVVWHVGVLPMGGLLGLVAGLFHWKRERLP